MRLVIAILLLTTPLCAEGILIYDQDERALLTGLSVCDPLECTLVDTVDVRPSPAFSDWAETLTRFNVTVSQSSTLGLSRIELEGSASAPALDFCRPCSYGGGTSAATVFFRASELSNLTLLGEADGASVQLFRDAPVGSPEFFNTLNTPIDFAGLLDADQVYVLVVSAAASTRIGSRNDARYDLAVSVTPIPEPSTATVLALSIAAIAASRRCGY